MSAVISSCGQYRYELTRADLTASALGLLPFVMLNPSTADARRNDPTIGRCCSFAQRFGYGGIVVGNVYALRSPDPAALWAHADPVGPENDTWLLRIAQAHQLVVCAWGGEAKPARVREVAAMLTAHGARLVCLGATKSGAPRHPLYVRGDQPLIDWSPA